MGPGHQTFMTNIFSLGSIVTTSMFVPPAAYNDLNSIEVPWSVVVGTSSTLPLYLFTPVSPCAAISPGASLVSQTATLRQSISLPPWIALSSSSFEL